MKTLQTEVLVIGGGATGTGVARDLTVGTTGRYHGLLHSGSPEKRSF